MFIRFFIVVGFLGLELSNTVLSSAEIDWDGVDSELIDATNKILLEKSGRGKA